MSKCLCCNHDMSTSICTYCGMRELTKMSNDPEEIKYCQERAKDYRNEVLNNIKNISINTYEYSYDSVENISVNNYISKKHKISDGINCYNNTVWLNIEFEKNPDETETTRELELSYSFNGALINTKARIHPDYSLEKWKIGARINNKLELELLFGNEQKNSKTIMELKLK